MPERRTAIWRERVAAAGSRHRGTNRWSFGLNARGCSDTGRKRQSNEDAFLLTDTLVAVADGLGGHAGGGLASTLAIESLCSLGPVAEAESLRGAFAEAHRVVRQRAAGQPELEEMCTTLCALALDPAGRVVLANVGDSRIYRFSHGRLEQVTWDHNIGNEYERMGLSAPEAQKKSQAGKLTRVVGAFPAPCEVDIWTFDAADGDRYLLTSDGLTRELADADIAALLTVEEPPELTAAKLVGAANDRGGSDNITVIVADIVALEIQPLR